MNLSPPRSNAARVIAAITLSAVAFCAVLVLPDNEGVLESTNSPVPAANFPSAQIGTSLQQFDSAISSVDQGIENSKSQLVGESHKLGEATKLVEMERTKLMQDQQVLVNERARSRSMKMIRFQLAQKQKQIMLERRKLQVHSLQLAQLQQKAKALLLPTYKPSPQEIQAVVREIPHAAPMPAMPPVQAAEAPETKVPGAEFGF